MALAATPRTFKIDGACTVADLLTIADTLRRDGTPPDTEIRVLTRLGGHHGSHIRQVTLLPANGGRS